VTQSVTERARKVTADIGDRIPDEESFTSPLHSTRTAAILGIALGIAFSICFLTGIVSHLHQNPVSWLPLPSRPAGMYRVSQSLHIATGIFSIPLLLAKLWTVYPFLWKRPVVGSVAHFIERVSLIPLVGGSLFMLFSGAANIVQWYTPMDFYFTSGHYWGAWITMGGLVIHIGAKASIAKLAISRQAPDLDLPSTGGLDRRGFLGTIFGTAGVLTLATAGQTVWPLRHVSVLAPRRPDIGPQGHPINKTFAESAIKPEALTEENYRLVIGGAAPRGFSLTLAELRAMPQHETELPIQCVEGWSYSARWKGVRLSDLLDRAGVDPDASIRVDSIESNSLYGSSPLNSDQARDGDTILALEIDGEPLAPDHGYPVRLIAPNRPGVQQTKWLGTVFVL